jgi:nitrous oxidase accessory protein
VRGNWIEGVERGEGLSANGIHSWNSRELTIEANRVTGHRDGIYLEFTSESTITENEASDNARYGLHFMYSDGNRFYRNRFAANGAGVAVMYSRSVEVEENEFVRHEGRASYGLLLKEISHSLLVRNQFSANAVAMHLDTSSNNRVTGNVFEQNGLAVSLWASAEGNEFASNSFVNNLFDFHTNSTGASTNVLRGNYYSSYVGYDLDHDGFGDLPYRPIAYSAVVLARYPLAGLLAKSPFFELLDLSERLLPAFAPSGFVDESPALRPPKEER